MPESQDIEKKALASIVGKSSKWQDLVRTTVCFANARGGVILIGIEDDDEEPPSDQKIDKDLPEKIQKNIRQNTHNVGILLPEIMTAKNGGEFIELKVLPSKQTIASTSDGKYYMRVSDECHPILPDQIARLVSEKNAFVWELQVTKRIPKDKYDDEKLKNFLAAIRSSDRVSDFIKNKPEDELLDHYFFTKDGFLTNLGILWIGVREDRASLLYSPSIQFIRYDQRENKLKKIPFDDYSLNPLELLEAVISLPDWNESTEVSEGIFRNKIPNFDSVVIRELVANALVHRVYVMQGDIYVNLYPDRLEVHNPGLLPLGVTPNNILHQSVHRNDHLSKVFYDLKLMEKEGSGYDRIYQILLADGKQLPKVQEQHDRVIVTVFAKIFNMEALRLMERVSKDYEFKQRELIALGLIAQHSTLSAIELSRILALKETEQLDAWIGNLLDQKLILSKGRTKGKEYFVNPELLRKVGYRGKTTLKQIEDHRLRELILADLEKFPKSLISEIHHRIGKEIAIRRIRKQLKLLIEKSAVQTKGGRKYARYSILK